MTTQAQTAQEKIAAERRLEKRWPVDALVRLKLLEPHGLLELHEQPKEDEAAKCIVGQTRDLSLGGVLLVTPDALLLGRMYRAEFEGKNGQPVTRKVEILRSNQIESSRYESAARFCGRL